MKILLATYWLLPHVGGVWTYMKGLKRGLEQLGHEVDILARDPDDRHYYLLNKHKGVPKESIVEPVRQLVRDHYKKHLPHVGNWIIEQEVERNSFELAALYFGLKPYDLIHTQDAISTRALWRVKPSATPLVATIHGCLAAEYLTFLGTKSPPNDIVWAYTVAREYYGSTSSHLTICPTHWLKNMLADDYRVPSEHLRVIPYGLDIDKFKQRMEQGPTVDRPMDRWVLACPARLDVVKGHRVLLDALAELKRDRTDWVCWLIGGGNQRDALAKQAEQLGLSDHLVFWGDRPDVPSLLNQADIFVLPSLTDNQPYAIMEAQIAGKPVIVSDTGGIPEMVEQYETGILAKTGESHPLYQNLKDVMDNHVLRLYLVEKAKEFAETQWSLSTMTERTLEVYRDVMMGGGEQDG